METERKTSPYTCRKYRENMILLALQKRLSKLDTTPEEKDDLLKEIALVEARMGID